MKPWQKYSESYTRAAAKYHKTDKYRQRLKEKRARNKLDPLNRAKRILAQSKHDAKRRGYEPIRMTVLELDAWMRAQPPVCAACGAEKADRLGRTLVIDHCHRTGKVRGLLCSGCNFAVGMYESGRLVLAANYIRSRG